MSGPHGNGSAVRKSHNCILESCFRCPLRPRCGMLPHAIRLKSVSEKLGLSRGEYLASCHQSDLKRLTASFSGTADRSRRSHQRTAVYRRLLPSTTKIDLPAPAKGTDQPLAPIEDLGPGAILPSRVQRGRVARLLAEASQMASLAQPDGRIPTIRQAVMSLDEWRGIVGSGRIANRTMDGTYLFVRKGHPSVSLLASVPARGPRKSMVACHRRRSF
jgi:hypothetical protein